MKTALVPALCAAAIIYAVVWSMRAQETLATILDRLSHPEAQVSVHMTTITRTKTLPDGEVVTQTWTQGSGETNAAFRARVHEEWKALCADL